MGPSSMLLNVPDAPKGIGSTMSLVKADALLQKRTMQVTTTNLQALIFIVLLSFLLNDLIRSNRLN